MLADDNIRHHYYLATISCKQSRHVNTMALIKIAVNKECLATHQI
jgi:hypothetical protein